MDDAFRAAGGAGRVDHVGWVVGGGDREVDGRMGAEGSDVGWSEDWGAGGGCQVEASAAGDQGGTEIRKDGGSFGWGELG